ncbi:hypothetical protein DAI22_03g374000 [Oryza sativa Japonica Group]|nr:hypothetical protein DAI22_03g374000 [Oryza sativa Japonica Group]
MATTSSPSLIGHGDGEAGIRVADKDGTGRIPTAWSTEQANWRRSRWTRWPTRCERTEIRASTTESWT